MRRSGRIRVAMSIGAALVAALLVSACGAAGRHADARHVSAAGRAGVKAAAVQSIAVYPLAGTPDASPRSEISFRGEAPGQLTGIKVIGSKSGVHAGKLVAHSDGMGASFVPNKPFRAGELVRVRADDPLVGQRRGTVSFRVAVPPTSRGRQRRFSDPSKPAVPGTFSTVSRPDLHPPRVKVVRSTSSAASGYLFMAPKSGPGQDGPLIFDNRGRVVWFHPLQPGYKAYDFRAASYRGKPVLTWWQGRASGEYGGGVGVIADSSYHVIATVRGGNGYPVDIHEFRVLPGGTALIVSYSMVRWHNHSVLDSIAMQIDIKTRRVLFEWHSLGHIPISESYMPGGNPIDFAHLNSVDLDEGGDFLISGRDTSTVYKVDGRTGKILWRLGGKRSTFKLPHYARFVAQHDVTRAPDGTYTLFDNANMLPPIHYVSRGLVFSINQQAHRAHLLRAFRQPQRQGATTQGSMQVLPDGHYLVGWGGGIPEVSEFTPGGRLVYDARLQTKVQSYRDYRFPWTGQPKRAPDVVARTKKGRTTAYVSWNGATELSGWQVLAGSSRQALKVVARAPWRGLETAIRLPANANYVAARAVDNSGNVLATSRSVRTRR